MEMRLNIKSIILAAGFLAVFSCQKNEIEDYLNLSVYSYTFANDGSDSVVVEVNTNLSGWTVQSSDESVSAEQIDECRAVVKMLPNTTNAYLEGSVKFCAGDMEKVMSVRQLPSSFDGIFKVFPLTTMGAMSRNGKWYAYIDRPMGDDGKYYSYGKIINLETGEEKDIDIPEGTESEFFDCLRAVSDDGKFVLCCDGRGGPLSEVMSVEDGSFIQMQLPEGYSVRMLQNMSSDASVVIGSCRNMNNGMWEPFKWVNGEPIALDYPETDAYGVPTYAVYPRGCSDDGSIIYGSEWSSFGLIYWKDDRMYNIGIDNSTVSVIDGGQFANIIRLQAAYGNISPSGKYIVSNYRDYTSGSGIESPVRINTETGVFEILEGVDCGGNTVTDEGLVFGAAPATMSSGGAVVDFEKGTSVPLVEYMESNYGLVLGDFYWVNHVSPDQKAFAGRCVVMTGFGPRNPYWFVSFHKVRN